MGVINSKWLIAVAITLQAALLPLQARSADSSATQPAEPTGINSGGRAPFVHNVNLYDKDGTLITPGKSTTPYSPAATCGKCHDVEKINHGWHFNAPAAAIHPGRKGEPWILNDETTRTQIPLSSRNWPGTFKPETLGLTPIPFTEIFARHMPGGGMGNKINAADEPAAKITGALEVDCLICHLNDRSYNPIDRARQIEYHNFMYAPTVAARLGVVKGEARKVPADYDPELDLTSENPNVPTLKYDPTRFDPQNRVHFEITRQPSVDNCYYCHSTRLLGAAAPHKWNTDADVHIQAGLKCTDCHRNGIDHGIVRGYEGEKTNSEATTLSCAGCHASGRLGAPQPVHKGLPPVHFDKLTCTACHSGPEPKSNTVAVQTSFAHALGLSSESRNSQTPPHIVEPVFVKQPDGKIAPARMLWPSFWGRQTPNGIQPLLPEKVLELAGDIFKANKNNAGPLTTEMITAVLAKLGKDAVYVHDGKVTRNKTDSSEAPAQPYTWAFAHDVRPARQALGVKGCTDCHAADSPIFFGKVTAASGIHSEPKPIAAMYELEQVNPDLAKAWGQSFQIRPAFKIFAFTCAGLITAVLILNGLLGLRALLNLLAGRSKNV
jgi:hypothetical protein